MKNREEELDKYMDEQYPKGYFSYFLSMFTQNFETPSADNYDQFTGLYLQMQSKKELENLRVELKKIKRNKDHDAFVEMVGFLHYPNFTRKDLEEMMHVVEKYELKKK